MPEQTPPEWPEIQAIERTENGIAMQLHVPAGLRYFQGHFPEEPILPGVVQTHWAACYARQHLSPLAHFDGMAAIKFQNIVRPDSLIQLTLSQLQDGARIEFAYDSDAGRHSSGRLLFTAN